MKTPPVSDQPVKRNTSEQPIALVQSHVENHIGTITLNDPETLNSLSGVLIKDLLDTLDRFRGEEVRVVILRARLGSKTWSAGHNVGELPKHARDPLTYSDPLRVAIRKIQEYPSPVIAMVEGGVWGGACELVMACDLVVAVESATFAITPARLGVPYNIGGVQNMIGSVPMVVVKEMLFRAKPISAQRAYEVGIANYVVPANQLEAKTLELAQDMLANSPLVITLLKEETHVLAHALALSAETFERIQSVRRRIYDSEDYQEGIRSFFEKRKPIFQGK
ncbi:MAG: methylmalonyl-CoA decarboxylase [Acidobacteria bacterium]|nr:MAG: methylmalonyl-CoA decarboxylase [Acidobacteriota bacterium]